MYYMLAFHTKIVLKFNRNWLINNNYSMINFLFQSKYVFVKALLFLRIPIAKTTWFWVSMTSTLPAGFTPLILISSGSLATPQ